VQACVEDSRDAGAARHDRGHSESTARSSTADSTADRGSKAIALNNPRTRTGVLDVVCVQGEGLTLLRCLSSLQCSQSRSIATSP